MSYCRGPDSDVYCYGTLIGDSEAWMTHVSHKVGLSRDGETFVDDTLGGFKTTLISLRAVGYRVPQRALDRIEAELLEASSPS